MNRFIHTGLAGLAGFVTVMLVTVWMASPVFAYTDIIRDANPELSDKEVQIYSDGLVRSERIVNGLPAEVLARAIAENTGFGSRDSERGIGMTGLPRAAVQMGDPDRTEQTLIDNPEEAILLSARFLQDRRDHYGSWMVALSEFLHHDHSVLFRVLDAYHSTPDLLSDPVQPYPSRDELYRDTIARLHENRTNAFADCSRNGQQVGADELARTILQIAREVDVPSDLIFSIAWQETHMRCVTGDIHLPHHSHGIMQVQQRTAQFMLDRTVDPEVLRTDLEKNLRAGARYLRYWKDRHGNYASAIFHYNGGSVRYLHNVLARWSWLQEHHQPDSSRLACQPNQTPLTTYMAADTSN